MDQNFQTSFIPKKPMVEKRVTSSTPISFFTVISIFIFFAMVLGTGGLYIYRESLKKNITTINNSLILDQKGFEADAISGLQTLGKRLTSANTILSNHIEVSPVFKVLQDLTLKSIRYTKFSYSIGDKNQINISMSGQSVGYSANTGYKAIALQSDIFATSKDMIDPVFSNLSLNDKGDVLFDLQFSVNSSFVNYKNNLSAKDSGIISASNNDQVPTNGATTN